MPEHFSKAVVEAKFRCPKCNKDTMHYVSDGRRGGCKECIARAEQELKTKKPDDSPKPPEQKELFFG